MRLPDDGHGYDAVAVPVIDPRAPAEQQDEARHVLAQIVLHLCAPSQPTRIIAEIAKLRAVCAAREQSETDARTVALVYAEDLREYPEDVIRAACRDWRRAEKWFPTIAELRAAAERHMRKRRAWMRAEARAARGPLSIARPAPKKPA